jgi:hypothetical protein
VKKKGGTNTVKNFNTKLKTFNNIYLNFEGGRLTSNGGVALLNQFFYKLYLKQTLYNLFSQETISSTSYSYPYRNMPYPKAEMILSQIFAIALELFSQNKIEKLRKDTACLKIIDLKRCPSQPTLSRFYKNITSEDTNKIANLSTQYLKRIRKTKKRYILDFDTHVITVYGNQQKAKIGYNPKKPNRRSYHPILCFLGTTRDFLYGKFREGGGRISAKQARRFLEGCIKCLPEGKKQVFIRADAGFFSYDFVQYLCKKGIKFAIKFDKKPKFIRNLNFIPIDNKRFISCYSKEGLKYVVVKYIEGEKTRHEVIVTNMTDKQEEFIWRFYNKRANVENMIKEGVWGYNLDTVISHKFSGNAFRFQLVMFVYNLLNWFKEKVLNLKKVKRMIKWVRVKFFFIAAKLVNTGRKWILKLSSDYPWKEEFISAWRRLDNFVFQ